MYLTMEEVCSEVSKEGNTVVEIMDLLKPDSMEVFRKLAEVK